jgi:murein DD-endopeptidase MepM/ murein hydrolase activator NlpD
MQTPLRHMRLRRYYGGHPNIINPPGQESHPEWSLYGHVRPDKVHQGWDLRASPGTDAYAVSDGRCVGVRTHDTGDYGRYLVLQFVNKATPGSGVLKIPWVDSQTFYAFYAHLDHVNIIEGQEVAAGTLIARTGRSGNAKQIPFNQAHLHFEIKTWATVMPEGLNHHIDPQFFLTKPLPEPIEVHGNYKHLHGHLA